MFLRALAYLLLPPVVLPLALAATYLAASRLFPHWSADAHATLALIVAGAGVGALVWAAVARGHRRGRDEFSRRDE